MQTSSNLIFDMFTFIYEKKDEPSVEMRFGELDPNEILEVFQRFLIAAGYVFDEGETIDFVKREPEQWVKFSEILKIDGAPGAPPPAKITTYGGHDFWDEDGFSLTGNPARENDHIFVASGVRGGMAEDILKFS